MKNLSAPTPVCRLARLFRSGILLSLAVALMPATASAQLSRAGESKSLHTTWTSIGNDVCFDERNGVYLVISAYREGWGMFANAAGDLVGSAFPIGSGNANSYAHYPKCGYSPHANGGQGGFLVTYHMNGGVYGSMVAYPAGVISAERLLSNFAESGANGLQRPAVAYSRTSSRFLVAWTTYGNNIHGRLVDNTGAPAGDVVALAGGNGQRDPSLAWHPTSNEFGLATAGWVSNSAFVQFRRVRASDAFAFPPGTFGYAGGTFAADVEVNSANGRYIVGWSVGSGALSAGFDQNGAMVSQPSLISSAIGTPTSFDLAYNPVSGSFLAASEHSSRAVVGTELGGTGVPLQTAVVLTDGATNGSYVPRIAARTTAREWNISYTRNLSVISDQIIATGSSGGGGTGTGAGGGGGGTPSCSFSVSPTSISAPRGGGGGVFTITTAAGCNWTASTSVDWVALGDRGGNGTTTIYFASAPNLQPQQRTAAISVGGQTVTITQAAGFTVGADFSGDGRPDILWQNFMTGHVSLWRMQGLSAVAGAPLGPGWIPDSRWRIVGASDINRDGHTDVIWQHDGGHVSVWYMRGETQLAGEVITQSPVPPGWRIAATGDLDGDSRADFIWQHPNGTLSVWYMDGAVMRSAEIIVQMPNTSWRVVAAGDFNRDGWLDLVWRDTDNGQNAIWFMRNRQLLSGALTSITVPDQNWQIAGVTDFNADGYPDLIWRNRSTGALSGWLMNGGTVVAAYWLNPGAVDTNWVTAGPK